MKKLNLDVDTLRVESFATASHGPGERGTVYAHDHSYPLMTCAYRCTNYGSCQGTCVQTCTAPECAGDEPTLYMSCADCYWDQTGGASACVITV